MACTKLQLAGIDTNCQAPTGGVDVVYVIDRDFINAVTVTTDKITAITTKTVSPSTTAEKFKTLKFRNRNATVTNNYEMDEVSGSHYCRTEIVIDFAKQETAKRVSLVALASNDLAVIYKLADGTYWYCGYDRAANVSAMGGESGTAFNDAQKYTVTIAGQDNEYPYEVDEDIIAALVE